MWIVYRYKNGEPFMINTSAATKIERDCADIILSGQPVVVTSEDGGDNEKAVLAGIQVLEFETEEKAKRAFYKICSCLADGNIKILNLSEEKNATEFSINTKN